MAGRDHHFIPQLLQKGFSAGQTKKKKHQVWVFRRGQETFKTGTLNSFVERDFYGPPSAAPVDQLITDEETKLDKFVTDARASTATRSLSAEELAVDLVLQISIRVRWIREFMIAAIQRMIERTQSTFADKAALGAGYRKQFEQNPAWLHTELLKQAEKLRGRPLNDAEKALVATIEAQLRANPEKLAEFAPALPPLDRLQDGMKKATEQGHLKGLASALHARATKYREFLSRMRWSVLVLTQPRGRLGSHWCREARGRRRRCTADIEHARTDRKASYGLRRPDSAGAERRIRRLVGRGFYCGGRHCRKPAAARAH